MYRHRRHVSLDSSSASLAGSKMSLYPGGSYMLQGSAGSMRSSYTLLGCGPRTARLQLQQHTSPLALMQSITPPSPHESDNGNDSSQSGASSHGSRASHAGPSSGSLASSASSCASSSASGGTDSDSSHDLEDSDDPDEDAKMDEEMERMVSSVVNSPTSTDGAVPAASSSSSLLHTLTTTTTLQPPQLSSRRSLLGLSSQSNGFHAPPPVHSIPAASGSRPHPEHDPKLNMGMRAAFGNYRKRLTSALASSVRPNMLEQASRVASSNNTAASSSDPTSSSSSGLLAPPNPDLSPRGRSTHRRSVSTGALPSLDQIAEWSQRRHAQHAQQVAPLVESVRSGLASGLDVPSSNIVFVAPPRQDTAALRASVLSSMDLNALTYNGGYRDPSLVDTSPAVIVSDAGDGYDTRILGNAGAAAALRTRSAGNSPATSPTADPRQHFARQMVSLLEKRRGSASGDGDQVPEFGQPQFHHYDHTRFQHQQGITAS